MFFKFSFNEDGESEAFVGVTRELFHDILSWFEEC